MKYFIQSNTVIVVSLKLKTILACNYSDNRHDHNGLENLNYLERNYDIIFYSGCLIGEFLPLLSSTWTLTAITDEMNNVQWPVITTDRVCVQ